VSVKELAFMAFFLGGSTCLAAAGIALPKLRRVYLVLFFLGVLKIVDINFVSREAYRGWVRGFEIGSLDMILIGLAAIAVAGAGKRPLRLMMPVLTPLFLFVVVTALSVVVAFVPLYAGFGLLKAVRDLIAFWIIANSVHD